MSESEAGTRFEADTHRTDQPLIGLSIDASTNPDAVAGAILRATERGHDVAVEHTCERSNEAVSFANRLGAHVIRVENSVDGEPSGPLLHHARDIGYSGVVWVGVPSHSEESSETEVRIDLEESARSVQRSNAYVAAAVRDSDYGQQNGGISSAGSSEPRSDARDLSIAAIVPAYNEAETIGEVIEQTKQYVDSVFVVNDASSDATSEVAQRHADGVLDHPKNMGVGGAVDTGYQVAIREGYDVVVQIDGDGQHDPSYIPEMLETMAQDDVDMVIGSRWLNDSYRDYSVVRRAGIRFFTFEANVLGDLDITDVTSGFRAYDVEMLEDLGRPDNSHWALEQTLEAARSGYSIEEISVPMPPETDGSQFTLDTLLKYPPRMVLTSLKVLLFR